MDTSTFPVLVVPDVPHDVDAMLTDSSSIHLGEDIRNPVLIIDNITAHLKEKDADTSWLHAVREFSHKEQVNWILSLPDPGHEQLTENSFVFPVTVHFTLMVKVAEAMSGESLYEKKELEKMLEKCIPV
jgi:aspartyl aminopeptidase